MKNLFLFCAALICATQLSAQVDRIELKGCERTIQQFGFNADETLVYGIGSNFDVVNQEKSLRTYLFVWDATNGSLLGKKNLSGLTKSVVLNGVKCKGNLGQIKLDIPNNRVLVLGDQYQTLLPDGSSVYYNGVLHVLNLNPSDESVKSYIIPAELKPSSVGVNPIIPTELVISGTCKGRQILSIYPLDSLPENLFHLYNEAIDFKSSSYPFFNSNFLTYSLDGKSIYAGFGLKGEKGGFMCFNVQEKTSKKITTNFAPAKIKFVENEIIITTKNKLTLIFDQNTLAQKKSYPVNYLALSADKKYALERTTDTYLLQLKNLATGAENKRTAFRIADAEFNGNGTKIIVSRLKGYQETLEEDQQNPSLYILNTFP